MRVHEMMADNRLRFAQRLNEMSEELNNLVKEVEKNRKQVSWVPASTDALLNVFAFQDEGPGLKI